MPPPLAGRHVPQVLLWNAPMARVVTASLRVTTAAVSTVGKVGTKQPRLAPSPVLLVPTTIVTPTKFALVTPRAMTRVPSSAEQPSKMHPIHVPDHAIHQMIVRMAKLASHSLPAMFLKRIYPWNLSTAVKLSRKHL